MQHRVRNALCIRERLAPEAFSWREMMHGYVLNPRNEDKPIFSGYSSAERSVIAAVSVQAYQLYFLRDNFVDVSSEDAHTARLAVVVLVGMSVGIVVAPVLGPLSDRQQRRKIYVHIALRTIVSISCS